MGRRKEEGKKEFITFQRYEKYQFNVETLSYFNFADFYIFPPLSPFEYLLASVFQLIVFLCHCAPLETHALIKVKRVRNKKTLIKCGSKTCGYILVTHLSKQD